MLEISAVGRRLPQGPACNKSRDCSHFYCFPSEPHSCCRPMCLWRRFLQSARKHIPYRGPSHMHSTHLAFDRPFWPRLTDLFTSYQYLPLPLKFIHFIERGEIFFWGHPYFIKITHPSICPHTAPCCVSYWRSLATPRHSSEGRNLFNPCTSGWIGPLRSFRNIWRFDMFPCFTPSIFGTA